MIKKIIIKSVIQTIIAYLIATFMFNILEDTYISIPIINCFFVLFIAILLNFFIYIYKMKRN